MNALTPAAPQPKMARRPAERYAVTVVEHPDPSGTRWDRALDLLLEAGHDAEERAS